MDQTINVKPSFFDEPATTPDPSAWKKGPPLKKASEVRIIEGVLFKPSATNFNKSRYYVLFEDRLGYYKSAREKVETAHCNVQNMRVEKISENDKEEKFGIRLIHNREYFEVWARAKDVQEKWLAALSKFCVLTNYSSSFVNIKAIGKGSFARVFLAKRKSDNAELAVKTFDKRLLLSADKARASLLNEINIMRKLEHDHVIKLYEVYESDNHIYLVLELLHGGELFERIVKKGQYNEQDASILMKNLLSSLAYMHGKGIMHRDLKPENLILKDNENDWDIKIADFGLSTVISCSEYLFKRCGTPGYVAPEILADEKYDEKVDVFSAGVILYILVSGGSPFYGKSYNQILWKNKNCEINYNFKEFGQRVSDLAIDLMKKMLTKDPKIRIAASDALKHPWISSGGVPFSPRTMTPVYLSSAQENMKRFQEENRFNVKNIKPKDLDKGGEAELEKSGHAPSPLINGRVVTVAGSKDQFQSPDVRKAGGMNMGKFVGMPSPQGATNSMASTDSNSSEKSALSERMSYLNANLIGGFNPNQNLLTNKIPEAPPSGRSSISNTPVVQKKPTVKKALNVQGTLLKYLGITSGSNQQKVAPVNEKPGENKENAHCCGGTIW